MNNRYEEIYGVGLLDDLHNYFPALLYEQGRFTRLNEVFHYVRTQMNERFNLYSYGASRFNRNTADQPPLTPPPIPQEAQRGVRLGQRAEEFIPARRFTPPHEQEVDDLLSTLGASNILLSLFNPGGRIFQPLGRQTGWADPVVVRPTQEVIEANSTRVTGLTGVSCAICQEQIQQSEQCRRLNCNHTYHRNCIDTWFQRSTRCPTCRHDIRERVRGDISTPSNTTSQNGNSIE